MITLSTWDHRIEIQQDGSIADQKKQVADHEWNQIVLILNSDVFIQVQAIDPNTDQEQQECCNHHIDRLWQQLDGFLSLKHRVDFMQPNTK